MSHQSGRLLRLSPFRKVVTELMHHCRKVPGGTIERPMNLAPLVAARQACLHRPSWSGIFLKAMSIVAARRPELRRSYMPFPWAHLYEHSINIANFTIERRYQEEDVVFFVQVRRPEHKSLAVLDRIIHQCKDDPVESVKFFRRAIRMTKVPWFLRRLVFWVSLNMFGKLRCHNFGTFSLTSVASEGAGILNVTTLLTSTLHYGLFNDQGVLPMRMTFDHRALDGGTAARALVEMEEVLLTDILEEIQGMRSLKVA